MIIVMLKLFYMVHGYLWVYENQQNILLKLLISIDCNLKMNLFVFQNLSNTSDRSTFLENYEILHQLETLS